MSKLDELKKQASEVTQRNQVAGAGQGSGDEQWRRIAPVMKYLKDHFTELASTLNVLEKEVFVDFRINDAVTMKRLKCRNYKVTHPTDDKEKDWIFEFENITEHPTYTIISAGSAASKFKDLLSDNQIRSVTTPIEGNKKVKFEIRPPVRTKYRFTADLEGERIRLQIINYDSIWKQTNFLKKKEITQELMDELTHHAMRESNRFNELVGNTLSEEARAKLRQKLEADITAKKAQAETLAAAEAKQQQGKKEKTLLGKFFRKK